MSYQDLTTWHCHVKDIDKEFVSFPCCIPSWQWQRIFWATVRTVLMMWTNFWMFILFKLVLSSLIFFFVLIFLLVMSSFYVIPGFDYLSLLWRISTRSLCLFLVVFFHCNMAAFLLSHRQDSINVNEFSHVTYSSIGVVEFDNTNGVGELTFHWLEQPITLRYW